VDVLLICLFGAFVVAVMVRWHFNHAPDARLAVVDPLVFAIIGTQCGISAGMMWLWVDTRDLLDGKIDLEQGVRNACCGGFVGVWVGIGVKAVCTTYPRVRTVAFVLTLMLLAASLGAPLGWLYGVGWPDHDADDGVAEAVRPTQNGMLWGSAIGCAVGFALGMFELWFRGPLPKGVAATPTTENAVS
jgi:hypothetical protein